MKKPMTYLNLAMVVAALWLASGIRATWRQNHSRYALFAATAGKSPPVAGAAAGVAAATAAGAAAFPELVGRNLFSADRNNEQPVVKVEKKPAPPLPVVIGTLNLGSGPIALMAEQKNGAAGAFRRLRLGDEIGGYKIVEIAEHKVVLEFEGDKKNIDVYESADTAARSGQAPAPAPPPASSPNVISAVPSAAAPAAGTPQQPAASGNEPVPGNPTDDPFLTWVIEGNRKKFSRRLPFGVQVWYENLPAGAKPQ